MDNFLTKKEFISATGLTVPTLNRWLQKGTFKPAAYDDKGKALFSPEQVPEAKALHRPELNGNKRKNSAPATASLFDDASTSLVEEIPDVMPVDDDADDELIDPPTADLAPSALPEPAEQLSFFAESTKDVEVLPPDVVTLEDRAARIRRLSADVARGIVEIGFELIAAKEQVGHGSWAEWLKTNFDWTQRTASNFMRVANRFGKLENVFQFQPSALQAMLSLPDGEEAAFIASQADKGKPIEEMTAREVQTAVKDWKAAKEVGGETFQIVDFGRGNPLAEPMSLTLLEPVKTLPPLANRTGNYEWYTPPEYTAAVRQVMGGIDLDPTSCEKANAAVKATKYFTVEDDALKHDWRGRIFMNPPFSVPLLESLVDKFVSEYRQGNIEAGIVLTHNCTETSWFSKLVGASTAMIFTSHRISFLAADGIAPQGRSQRGQAFFYFGADADKFLEVFEQFGWGVKSSFLVGIPKERKGD